MPSSHPEAGLNIVVVEDHDALRELVCQALQERGHRATGLSCAEDLQDLSDRGSIDVFLLDLNLPGEDGLSLARRLRDVYPLVGIIMATARSGVSDRIAGYNCGADVYLSKPFELSELLSVVASLGRRRGLERGATDRQIGSKETLVVDPADLSLFDPKTNQTVNLTGAEVQILVALARAPGQRLSTWQIIEALGLLVEESSKASLEVRMTRLRKKLAQTAAAGDHCLQAIRGEGYQLCVPMQVL
jgi:DNA-binding response OmpR family regulator